MLFLVFFVSCTLPFIDGNERGLQLKINHFGHALWKFELYLQNQTYKVKLLDGKLHDVPDRETLAGLGVNGTDAHDATLVNIHAGHALQTMRLQMKNAHDYDEVMRSFIAKVVPLQYPLDIRSLTDLGPMINPALMHWQDTNQLLILAGPIIGGHSHRAFKIFAEGFALLNKSDVIDVPNSRKLFGDAFDCLVHPDGSSRDRWRLFIIDARLLPLEHNRVRIFFSNAYDISNPRMYSTTVHFPNDTHATPSNSNHTSLLIEKVTSLSHSNSSGKQKNWSPFIYNGRMLLVHSIRPWHILSVEDPEGDFAVHWSLPGELFGRHNTRTVPVQTRHIVHDAEEALDALGWNDKLFGYPRGGTPAVLLPGDMNTGGVGPLFMMVFHTRALLKSNINYSYFMGALTFCAKPPFRIFSISRVPMVTEEWYSGAWAGRALDYVLFPTGLVLERRGRARHNHHHHHNASNGGVNGVSGVSGANTTQQTHQSYDMVLSVGRQDTYGSIFRVGLKSVLTGMVRVGHCV